MAFTAEAGRILAKWRFGKGLPLAVFALGLLLTSAVLGWTLHLESARRQAEVAKLAGIFRAELTNRIQAYGDMLPGLRALFQRQSQTNDQDFISYLDAISLNNRFPGLAITFAAKYLTADAVPSFVASVRNDRSMLREGHPDFAISPLGQRSEYMVVRHLFPFNHATFGYDLYDPGRTYRTEAEGAILGGHVVATPPLLLAADRTRAQGPEYTSVVVRLPVYKHAGEPPATPEARREAAWGLVGVGFKTIDLVRSVLTPEMTDVLRMHIVDVRAQADGINSLVFDSSWIDPGVTPWADKPPRLRFEVPLGDRTWAIAVDDRPTGSGLSKPMPLLALMAGVTISSLAAAFVASMLQANRHAEERVAEATAALSERESLYRAFTDMSSDWQWELDEHFRYKRFHGEYSRRELFVPEKVVGRYRWDYAVNADDTDFWDAHRQVLEAHQPFTDFVYPAHAESGGVAYISASGSPVFAEDGSFRGYRGTARDVTELVRQQQQIARLNEELQARIAVSEGELDRRNAHLDIFASSIAHDLRAPLITIQGFSGAVIDDLGSEFDATQMAHLQRIRRAAREMEVILDDLLELSRLSKWKPRPRDIDLSAMARALFAELRIGHGERHVELQVADGLRVYTDRELLRLILSHLLNNASKFTQTRELAVITIALEDDGGTIVVADNGIGFSAPPGTAFTEPFKKFHGKDEFPGRGLGLAVCQRAAERLGGAMWIESKVDVGTTVRVRLGPQPAATGA